MAKDFYKVLGVPKGASKDEIRKAFKKLARQYHPDVNPGDKKAEDKFKEISEAYDVLSDEKKRKKYDTYGSADFDGFGGGPGRSSRSYYSSYNPYESSNKYSTQFEFGDLGDIFGDIFGAGAGAQAGTHQSRRSAGFNPAYEQNSARKGRDLSFTIDLDLNEAVAGCEKKIRLPNGTTFKVKIPEGVESGSKVRLSGKGEPGYNGGPAGDLFIIPQIKEHEYFKREGDDLYLHLPISVVEALKGAKIKVPTLDGAVNMKIPAQAQSGQKLRLKEKGVPNIKTKKRGDLYIILEVKVPKDLSEKDVEALEKILQSSKEDIRSSLK